MPKIEDNEDNLDYPRNDRSSTNKKLFNPDSFAQLCRIQAEIAYETGWQPSLNKLANALINFNTLSYLKKMMLLEFKDKSRAEKTEKPADSENKMD